MKRHLPFALTTLRLLLGGLIALLAFNASSWAAIALTIVALVTNAEIIALHLIMNSPPVDVHSILALPKR
jgi:hypothetical protein